MMIPPHWLYSRFGREELPPEPPLSPELERLRGVLVVIVMLLFVAGQVALMMWDR